MGKAAKVETVQNSVDLEVANILREKWVDEENGSVVVASEALDAELDAELDALDAQVEVELDEEQALIDAVDDLELADEIAAEAASAAAEALADAVDAAPARAVRGKGEKAEKGEKVKRERLNTEGMKPSEVIATKAPGYRDALIARPEWASMDDASRHAQVDALVATFDAMPKKVGEKAANLVQHLSGGATLSVYTKIAVDFLAEKGECTLKEMIAHFETGNRRPYSHGTASAQSSQMMALLPAVGIATREGSKLTYVANSPLGDWIVGVKVSAEAA